MNSLKNVHLKTFVIVIIAVAITICSALYIYAWRTPDAAYASALNLIDDLEKQSQEVDSQLEKLRGSTPTSINTDITDIVDRYNAFNSTLDKIASSEAILRDSKVKSSYKNIEPTIESYKQYIEKIIDQLNPYLVMTSECNNLFLASNEVVGLADFETKSSACKKSIDNTQQLEESSFTKSYLNPYSIALNKLVAAHKDLSIAKEYDGEDQQRIFDAYKKINEAELQLTNTVSKIVIIIDIPEGVKLDNLVELRRVVDNQKASILR